MNNESVRCVNAVFDELDRRRRHKIRQLLIAGIIVYIWRDPIKNFIIGFVDGIKENKETEEK